MVVNKNAEVDSRSVIAVRIEVIHNGQQGVHTWGAAGGERSRCHVQWWASEVKREGVMKAGFSGEVSREGELLTLNIFPNRQSDSQ